MFTTACIKSKLLTTSLKRVFVKHWEKGLATFMVLGVLAFGVGFILYIFYDLTGEIGPIVKDLYPFGPRPLIQGMWRFIWAFFGVLTILLTIFGLAKYNQKDTAWSLRIMRVGSAVILIGAALWLAEQIVRVVAMNMKLDYIVIVMLTSVIGGLMCCALLYFVVSMIRLAISTSQEEVDDMNKRRRHQQDTVKMTGE